MNIYTSFVSLLEVLLDGIPDTLLESIAVILSVSTAILLTIAFFSIFCKGNKKAFFAVFLVVLIFTALYLFTDYKSTLITSTGVNVWSFF